MDATIAAWFLTSPPGNIRAVMRTILDPSRAGNVFWSRIAYRAKVKTPVEYINSIMRALDWPIASEALPPANEAMGMHLFTRNAPDGCSEYGFDWSSVGSLLEKVNFVAKLSNSNADYLEDWDVGDFLQRHGLEGVEDIGHHFNRLLTNGNMPEHRRAVLLDFANRNGARIPLQPRRSGDKRRVEELIGLILAIPEGHYQ